MSDNVNDSRESIWINKLFPIGMSICIAASTWFLNQSWSKIAALESKMQQLEVSQASLAGTKFTNADWINAKNLIDAANNKLDLRVTRLEDNNLVIRDSLMEIKQILKDVK